MFSFAVVFSHIRQVSNHCHNHLDLPKPTPDCLGKDYSERAAAWRKLSWAAVLSSWLSTNDHSITENKLFFVSGSKHGNGFVVDSYMELFQSRNSQ